MNLVSFFLLDLRLSDSLKTELRSKKFLGSTTSWMIWSLAHSMEDLLNPELKSDNLD